MKITLQKSQTTQLGFAVESVEEAGKQSNHIRQGTGLVQGNDFPSHPINQTSQNHDEQHPFL